MTKTRLEFLKEQVDFKEILKHTVTLGYDEFVVDVYGDCNTYRVYGNSPQTYTITER